MNSETIITAHTQLTSFHTVRDLDVDFDEESTPDAWRIELTLCDPNETSETYRTALAVLTLTDVEAESLAGELTRLVRRGRRRFNRGDDEPTDPVTIEWATEVHEKYSATVSRADWDEAVADDDGDSFLADLEDDTRRRQVDVTSRVAYIDGEEVL